MCLVKYLNRHSFFKVMAEKDTIFSSEIKYGGVFSFKDFYQFCYEWLTDETMLDVEEEKYEEKIKGDEKEIKAEWKGSRKMTDYFKFEMKIIMEAKALKNVEAMREGVKIRTNQGSVKIKVKGILVKDYDNKFEGTAMKKFLRGIYEKWVIKSRVDEMEDKIANGCDQFLGQAKAWLDLEGKKS